MIKNITGILSTLIALLIINSCVNQYQKSPPEEYQVRNGIPTEYYLDDKLPTPFSPNTTITYSIPDSAHVLIIIQNVIGNIVDTVENQFRLPGTYKIEWEATSFVSGVYFYRMTTKDFTDIKKMVLLK